MQEEKPVKRSGPPVVLNGGIESLFARVRELIIAARRTVSRGVDLVQVHTCYQIGRHIVEYEQRGESRAGYGKEIIKDLAEKLSEEFGRGFSKTNLEYMRRFFLVYRDRAQIAPFGTGQSVSAPGTQSGIAQFETGQLAASGPRPFSLSWTHYVFLLGIKNTAERDFYEIEAAGQGWNINELKRQFNSGLYERLALSRDKKGIRRLAKEGQKVLRSA